MSVEIEEISKRVILVGKCRVELGEDGILYQSLEGDIDETTYLALKDAFLKLRGLCSGDVLTLVDLSKTGMQYSRARRKAVQDLEDTPVKIALFGVHPVAKVIANFFMSAVHNEKVRLFSSKEKAIEWLTSHR